MAAYTWPATMPKLLISNYEESPPDTVIRTPMDTGPPKQRNRFTAGERPIKAAMQLTDALLAAFDSFYVSDLSNGASRFDMNDPRTDVSYEWRFASVPKYTPKGPDSWIVTFDLERMPS